MIEKTIEFGISGVTAAVLISLLIEFDGRYAKSLGSNNFQDKGYTTFVFTILTILIGFISNELPRHLIYIFPLPEIQSIAYIITFSWIVVHLSVDDWNMSSFPQNNIFYICVIASVATLILPFIIYLKSLL